MPLYSSRGGPGLMGACVFQHPSLCEMGGEAGLLRKNSQSPNLRRKTGARQNKGGAEGLQEHPQPHTRSEGVTWTHHMRPSLFLECVTSDGATLVQRESRGEIAAVYRLAQEIKFPLNRCQGKKRKEQHLDRKGK